jgi:hypothetical protein
MGLGRVLTARSKAFAARHANFWRVPATQGYQRTMTAAILTGVGCGGLFCTLSQPGGNT